jgi:hypothetical protein
MTADTAPAYDYPQHAGADTQRAPKVPQVEREKPPSVIPPDKQIVTSAERLPGPRVEIINGNKVEFN